ncbi:hypothetical protein HMPREF9622_00659 [Cutibacterium modestum HL037PA3]|nr:hypothetical protein HMPREF9622_00659 [Cutibacterium modestum HL037PA3]
MVDTLRPGNGTTASTLRFSDALRAQGHQVRLLSAAATSMSDTDGIPVVGVPTLIYRSSRTWLTSRASTSRVRSR